MQQIYMNGPIQSCFVFPANFQKFFNEHPLGIYNTTEGQNITGIVMLFFNWSHGRITIYNM